MKILIAGTGGVGGFYGAKLAAAGNDVTFVARGKHKEAIDQFGLKVNSIDGDIHVFPSQTIETPSESYDLIIVATKVWQIQALEESIKKACSKTTIILPLCNGIEATDILSQFIEKEQVLSGLCRIFSYIEAPGVITHSGMPRPMLTFGEQNNRKSTRVTELLSIFVEAGIRANIADDIDFALWSKFIFITSTSAMGAITRVNYGTFCKGNLGEYLRKLIDEIVTVGKAKNVNIPENFAQELMALIEKMPAEATTSMQRDIMAGRPSELEAQLGAVVKLANKMNLDVPVSQFIYDMLLPQENRARTL